MGKLCKKGKNIFSWASGYRLVVSINLIFLCASVPTEIQLEQHVALRNPSYHNSTTTYEQVYVAIFLY